MGRRLSTLSLVLVGCLLGACRQAKVETYRIPKEKDPVMPAPTAQAADSMQAPFANGGGDQASMAQMAVPNATGNALTWKALDGWSKLPDQTARKATYSLPNPAGASELAITAFPGTMGGELANVNRWRGQVGLAALSEDQLEKAVTRLRKGDLTVTEVALEGPSGKGMLAAMIPYDGNTWFFKVTGSPAAVAAQKDAFAHFLESVSP